MKAQHDRKRCLRCIEPAIERSNYCERHQLVLAQRPRDRGNAYTTLIAIGIGLIVGLLFALLR